MAPPVEVDPYDDEAVEDTEVLMDDLFEEAADCVEAAIGKPLFSTGKVPTRCQAPKPGRARRARRSA